jgi:hypothetical protein
LPRKFWVFGGASEWFNAAPAHENAIGSVAQEREESGKKLLSSDFHHTIFTTTTKML